MFQKVIKLCVLDVAIFCGRIIKAEQSATSLRKTKKIQI
jgi:hypothetical protein